MSHITLITGGARSGKSSFAEQMPEGSADVLYIATAIRTDAEMAERIRHHIESRDPRWRTHEGFTGLEEVLTTASESFVLLDCVTNMVSNLMFSLSADPEKLSPGELDDLYQDIQSAFVRLLDAARRMDKKLILVSNEVGMGLISEYKLGRVFVDFAGWINQLIAREADEVIFMVSGLPLWLKQMTEEGA